MVEQIDLDHILENKYDLPADLELKRRQGYGSLGRGNDMRTAFRNSVEEDAPAKGENGECLTERADELK